jgi:hypothetical protein
MFQDSENGKTHYENDFCGEIAHNPCSCKHMEEECCEKCLPMPEHMQKKPLQGWGEKYNQLIHSLPNRVMETPREVVEQFISQLLQEQREEIIDWASRNGKYMLEPNIAQPENQPENHPDTRQSHFIRTSDLIEELFNPNKLK